MGLAPGSSVGQGGVRLGGHTPSPSPSPHFLCRVKPAVLGSLETPVKM